VALQQQLELTSSAPETLAEDDLRELADSWREGNEARERADAEPEDEDAGRSLLLTALAVVLCLGLGAGGFWFWRASQQTPDGQFTFVDSADQGVNDRAGAEIAGDGTSAAQAATPAPIAESDGTAGDTEARPEPATDGPVVVSGGDAAAPGAPEGTVAAAEKPDAATAIGAGGAAGEEPPAGREAAADVAAPGTPVRTADGTETAAPAVSFAAPASGPPLAYSLHVGSYQTFDAAQRAALALRARGLDAFVAPVLLEGKGEWHRVFVDALPDAPASQQSLARARESGAVAEGAVRETPWALYLGTFATRELAQELISRLARSGISGYAVGAGPVHVYAGAFEAAGDAEILNRQLRDRGFESALVRRRGVETR
jgi:cell division septation protein DedD